MSELMNEVNRLAGFLGVNVDQELTIDWVKTELVNKAEQGDLNSVYKMVNIARHCPQKDVVLFVVNNLNRLGYEVPNYSGLDNVSKEAAQTKSFTKTEAADVAATFESVITGLRNGGTDVASTNYALSNSNKTITIKKEYLTTLDNGNVVFDVVTEGGVAKLTVTIAAGE